MDQATTKKRNDGYANVMDHAVDQAKRYEELVEFHRAEARTPAGKKKVEGCMRWLTYCAASGG